MFTLNAISLSLEALAAKLAFIDVIYHNNSASGRISFRCQHWVRHIDFHEFASKNDEKYRQSQIDVIGELNAQRKHYTSDKGK